MTCFTDYRDHVGTRAQGARRVGGVAGHRRL